MDANNTGTLLPGGRYRLIHELGRGGLGIVYEAFDRLKRETVALKRLHLGTGSTWSEDESIELLMLAHEFRTGASLRHRHIVPLLDYGFDADRLPYFTMALIPSAQPLLPYLYAQTEVEQVRLLAQFLGALAYLHRCGIVHRDLKPGNILISEAGEAHLVDFGVALNAKGESTRGTELAGTPLYMSPEVLRGESATYASDLWAVGIILYEIYAGTHPYMTDPGDSISRVINRILAATPNLDKLRPTLVPIVGRLLLSDPADRYARAEDVIAPLIEATDSPFIPVEMPIDRESYLSAAPFTGRRAELKLLLAALEGTTLASADRAILLGGESGVGKSRLMDELRIRALVLGWLVVRGHASDNGGLPYQMWRDPLRRLLLALDQVEDMLAGILKAILPDIDLLLERPIVQAPPLQGAANEKRLDDAILQVLRMQTQPVLLLLEDIQWAGETDSLTPLRLLLGHLVDLPLLIVASYRTDEAPSLPAALPGVTIMTLTRLDDASVDKLVGAMVGSRSAPGLTERLLAETEGNVFFLVETLRELANRYGALESITADTLPPDFLVGGVSALIRRRLAQVPVVYRQTLQIAALIGRQIDPVVLEAIADDVDGFLSAAANAAVIEFNDGAWRFAHDKLRTGAIASLNEEEQIVLHCAIAIAIEQVYPDDHARAPTLVEHYHAAGDPRRACDRVITAANLLIETASYGQACALLELGLSLSHALEDDPLSARIVARLGSIHYELGRYDEAQAHFRHSLSLAERLDDELLILDALQGIARAASRAHDDDTTEAYGSRALALAHRLQDSRGEAVAASALGMAALRRGDLDSASAYHIRAAELAALLDEPVLHGDALAHLGLVALQRGDHVAAADTFQRALVIERAAGNLPGIAWVLTHLGLLHMQQDRHDDARAYFEEALTIFRRLQHHPGIAETISHLDGLR
ncbi:MAG: tetratricopeptide repeat protein [Chloroflexota bacterium]|nr:tetratricopeptide repeat protein [Chloroflexota bacterium]